jgi:lipopolysaccharide/colanic/teichoic acid biosynthesis glycosyltransferase
MDLDYIDKWSLSLDLLILVKTIPAVFKGPGAY